VAAGYIGGGLGRGWIVLVLRTISSGFSNSSSSTKVFQHKFLQVTRHGRQNDAVAFLVMCEGLRVLFKKFLEPAEIEECKFQFWLKL